MPLKAEISTCPYCNVPVISLWDGNKGCVSRKSYVLVADWVFHPMCWDEMVLAYPTDVTRLGG